MTDVDEFDDSGHGISWADGEDYAEDGKGSIDPWKETKELRGAGNVAQRA